MNPTKDECDRAIVALIKSTKRRQRPLDLVAVAQELKTAIQCFGSLDSVAEHIALTPSMLKRFQYVDRLEPSIRSLVEKRTIDSIDAVAELSSLSRENQAKLAAVLTAEPFQTEEIRNFVRLLNNYPELSIEEIRQKIEESKTHRVFVYEFAVRESTQDANVVKANILKLLKPEELASVEINGAVGRLKVFKSGKQHISAEARARRSSVTNLVQRLSEGHYE
jgi:hypothetical protein